MGSAVWRTVILAICVIAALSALTSVASVAGVGGRPPWSGRWGWVESFASPFSQIVDAVASGGPADRASLRAGDAIDLRANTLQERYWIQSRPLNGHAIALRVRRGAELLRSLVTPLRIPAPARRDWTEFLVYGAQFFVQPFMTLWIAFFAGLIAWRRSHVPEMRLLALTLATVAVSNEVGNIEWAVPWLWPRIVTDFAFDIAAPLAIGLSVTYAGYFARPRSRLRRLTQWLCYVVATVAIVQGIAGSVGFISLWFDPFSPALNWPTSGYALDVAAVACIVLALIASRGLERQRAIWTLVALAVLLYLQDLVFFIYSSVVPTSYFSSNVSHAAQDLILFLAPVALTYAALSRRLIDIGFVINRAAAYSAVSIIVVGLFMLGEWVLGTWFSRASHMTNVAIGAALAVVLGFSIRSIHARVERVLDHVFFRKRHEDERAIRAFGDEAADIVDDAALLRRAKETLEAHADASFVTFALRDGAGRYGDVSDTDPAILALRERGKVLDLQTLPTELRGEFAYPLISRGHLLGTLVLGPKNSGEAYAPDESHAIAQLAHEVGAALHILSLAKVLRQHHLEA